MKTATLVLLLIAMNPIIFGIIFGFLTRNRHLPSTATRLVFAGAYFVVTYGLLWAAMSLTDFNPYGQGWLIP